MDYRDMNDFELVSYVKENNEEANEIIYEKYKPLIENSARKILKYCKYTGLELSDLVQEGMLGLTSAINTFDESKEASFFTYARMCIERKQFAIIKKSQRDKHKPLNESLSFEAISEDNSDISQMDVLFADNSYNPENILEDDESLAFLKDKISKVLTDFEAQIFELRTHGFTYTEISNILEIDYKQIDNALQRIKTKLKKLT